MRNQGRHARQNRCRSGTDWVVDRGTARETDAGRGQMSRSSDAHIRDKHTIAICREIVGVGKKFVATGPWPVIVARGSYKKRPTGPWLGRFSQIRCSSRSYTSNQ